jgi:tetratricopeptide (TPR) repeat protein
MHTAAWFGQTRRVAAVILACLCLGGWAGCASPVPPAQVSSAAFDDAAYGAELPIPTRDEIFAVTPAMKAYLRTEAAEAMRAKGKARGLFDALYTQGRLRLEYDSSRTRTAAEAFDARAGNCLSLAVLTAALAEEVGLQVHYQDMQTRIWERHESTRLDLSIGHVNILLGQPLDAGRAGQTFASRLMVDFLPGPPGSASRGEPIDESRVVAMVLNNRAAEALLEGKLRGAYWHARAALRADRQFAHAWNTLGVVHSRRGLTAPAEAALRMALHHDPQHEGAMGNLSGVLQALGRHEEAAHWALRQQERLPEQPMLLYQAGRRALAEGRWSDARRLLQRALRLAGDWHELHFALAQAYAGLGDQPRTEQHLALAREHGSTPALRERYGGKLERLQLQAKHLGTGSDTTESSRTLP